MNQDIKTENDYLNSKIIYHLMVTDSVMKLTTGTKERLGLGGDMCVQQREQPGQRP